MNIRHTYVGGTILSTFFVSTKWFFLELLEFFAEVLGLIEKDESVAESRDVIRGTLLEPIVLDLFAKQTSLNVLQLSDQPPVFHPWCNRVGGHPDAVVVDENGRWVSTIEVKCPRSPRAPEKKWVYQLLFYSYLLRKTNSPIERGFIVQLDYEKFSVVVDEIEIDGKKLDQMFDPVCDFVQSTFELVLSKRPKSFKALHTLLHEKFKEVWHSFCCDIKTSDEYDEMIEELETIKEMKKELKLREDKIVRELGSSIVVGKDRLFMNSLFTKTRRLK